MRAVVVVMVVAVTLAVVAVGLAAWWVTRLLRRVRRSTRRLVNRGTLSVKAHLVPGSARQVAAARLQLSTGIDRTRRVLQDASRRNCPLGDLPGLFRRIEHLAGSVHTELEMLDGDRDPAQRERLASVLRRSEQLASMTAAIRRTVTGLHADMHLDGFGQLQRDLDVELSALRAGAAAVRQPGMTPLP